MEWDDAIRAAARDLAQRREQQHIVLLPSNSFNKYFSLDPKPDTLQHGSVTKEQILENNTFFEDCI